MESHKKYYKNMKKESKYYYKIKDIEFIITSCFADYVIVSNDINTGYGENVRVKKQYITTQTDFENECKRFYENVY